MSPSTLHSSTPALSDVTNGTASSPASQTTPTPVKPVTNRLSDTSATPPDTPVTPHSPYVTATSTPAHACPHPQGLAAAVEQQRVLANAVTAIDPTQKIAKNDQEDVKRLHMESQQHNDSPNDLNGNVGDDMQASLHDSQPTRTSEEPEHPMIPDLEQHGSFETNLKSTGQVHTSPEPSARVILSEPQYTNALRMEATPVHAETSEHTVQETNQGTSPTVALPVEEHSPVPIADLIASYDQGNMANTPRYEDNSPEPNAEIYLPAAVSESASHNSPPRTPPPKRVNRPLPPKDPLLSQPWIGPTVPRSPKFRLAAAAAARAPMAPASPKQKSNGTKKPKPVEPFQPTRPVSPKFRLAIARAAKKRVEQEPAKKKKSQPTWGTTTVPKSPMLRCASKALSAEAAARKAALIAEKELRDAELRQRSERLRANRASWATTRTDPKSPAVLRRPSNRIPKPEPKKRFTPIPLPDFGHAPPVRQTRASIARLERKTSVPRSMSAKPLQQKMTKPLGKTVPHPFPLRSVQKHEEVVEMLHMRQKMEEAEARRNLIFEPVPLREEILEGPTFVPVHNDASRTDPVSLIPDAEERSRRTLAYLAAQRERMEEMERRKQQAAREREEREMEDAEREWQEKRFKPQPVPKSHYKPHIRPVCSIDGSRSPGTERDLLTPDSRVGVETQETTPGQDSSERVPRRPSIFEGLRKSLSPLLGSPDSVAVHQEVGESQ